MGRGCARWHPSPATSDQAEGVVGGVVADPLAGFGAEERVVPAGGPNMTSPLSGVVAQRRQGAGMQRDETGQTAFAGSDRDHAGVEVDIGA